MSALPLVSVLLPCRNAGTTLNTAIESLVGQTYDRIEIIAVDDGSTDDTATVLSDWARRDPRIRVLGTEPRGIVNALNSAAAVADGSLLARMDADDVSARTRIQRQVELFAENPELSACGTGVRYFSRGLVLDGARRYESWLNTLVSPDEIARDLFVECPIAHPTLMLRDAALRDIGGYRDLGWPEDYDLVLRLALAGHRLGKVPEILLDWRDGADRLSRTDRRYSADAFRRCKSHFLQSRIAGRSLVICGAGPVGKAIGRVLQADGHDLAAFVDLDPRKIGQRVHGAMVVPPAAVSRYRDHYFLAAVGSEPSRWEIREYLTAAGMTEIVDFCAVA